MSCILRVWVTVLVIVDNLLSISVIPRDWVIVLGTSLSLVIISDKDNDCVVVLCAEIFFDNTSVIEKG